MPVLIKPTNFNFSLITENYTSYREHEKYLGEFLLYFLVLEVSECLMSPRFSLDT